VFLVHGHDERVRETVARFLEKLDLECVILHEQPNKGRTIIEKFEDYADVAFAVVLLTPDDRGGRASGPFESEKPRARQNVLLKLGFFLGALGRSRVCALYVEGVEIPSDYSGVLFLLLDGGGAWRIGLLRELIASGLQVDANRAFK
jgi:predicted nucleotide-binding protein